MRSSHSLTDDELKEYADYHLNYELEMLIWSAGILAFLATHKDEGRLPWTINNGLLNTFAIHTRSLIYFLYSRTMGERGKGRDHPTDIVIQDFVDASIVAQSMIKITPLLEEAVEKANKQVAHLTLKRIAYEKAGKEWKFIDVTNDLLKAFASIAPHIPTVRISENLQSKLLRTKLDAIPFVEISITHTPDGKPLGVCFSLQLNQSTTTNS